MIKTKILVAVGVLVLVVSGGGAAVYIKSKQSAPNTLGAATTTITEPAVVAKDLNPATGSNNSISLNQNFDTPQAGGLAVTSNSGSGSATQAAGTQQTLGQPANGGTNSANQSNPFDPTTFTQYEKYKNDQGGLFADVQAGTGATLEAGKKAAVYYRGWLTNGTKFDESRPGSDGKLTPFVFTLGQHQVITGWEQALAGMKVGGVRLVIVPPAVGYGAQAQNGIPANSVLIFQVQLAEVQ